MGMLKPGEAAKKAAEEANKRSRPGGKSPKLKKKNTKNKDHSSTKASLEEKRDANDTPSRSTPVVEQQNPQPKGEAGPATLSEQDKKEIEHNETTKTNQEVNVKKNLSEEEEMAITVSEGLQPSLEDISVDEEKPEVLTGMKALIARGIGPRKAI